MIEKIQANAQMTIEQLRPLSKIDFGYNAASVEWLEGYIERLRADGQFQPEAKKDKLISVFGSFLGECRWELERSHRRKFRVPLQQGNQTDRQRCRRRDRQLLSRRA